MKAEIHPVYRGNLVAEVENYLSIDPSQSIPDRLRERVRLSSDQLALKAGDQEITFGEFACLTNRLARRLLDNYRGEMNTVGLLFGHTPASIIAIYAVIKAGKIAVPLDRDYPASNLKHIIHDAGLKVLLTDSVNLSLVEQLRPENSIVINTESLDPEIPDTELDLSISGEAIAAIYYTSGSTGKPKGIIKKHGALHHRPYGFGVGHRQAHLASFAFSASLSTIFSALLSGTAINIYPVKEWGIGRLPEWLNENRIDVFFPPVPLFHQFVETLQPDDFFPHLRLVQLAGQRVSVSALESFRAHISKECLIKHHLASSEAGSSSAFIITSETILDNEKLPIGYPTIDKQVLIIDDDGNVLGPGEVGEIVVKGRDVAGGYWGEAQGEGEKFKADPEGGPDRQVFTGDMGLMRPDGLLEYRGRKDEMVKISGYRVELPLVEASLLRLEGIKDASVLASETESRSNRRLTAYLSLKPGHISRLSDLRRELAKDLPVYMLPTQFVVLDTLPRTPNGKIDRTALPAPTQANIARDTPYRPPTDDLQARLVKIWERVIGIHPIGIQDDFFAVGGDSLEAMRIFVEMERMLGKKLPLSLILKAATVEQQADLLRKEDWVADWSPLVAVQPHGSFPPLFCLPGVGGNVLNYHDLSMHLGPDQPVYALQSKGIGGQEEPLTNIVEIARYHIESIRELQPHGPYFLCGSSFGGKVAYEIAQQLFGLGEEAALVAMFDTYGPNYPKRLPGMTRSKVWLIRRIQKLNRHLVNIRALNLQGIRSYLRLRLPSASRRLRLWFSNRYQQMRFPLPEDLKNVRKANKIANRYILASPHFKGKLVLFRASHQPFGLVPDPLLGWGAVAHGRIEVIEVEGHHDALLWEPQVKQVAEFMSNLLKETMCTAVSAATTAAQKSRTID